MNYCEIKTNDIANGPGVRVSLFVSGCERHCKGCFQPETWDFKYGKVFTTDTYNLIEENLKRDEIEGLTILGGEPLHPKNIEVVRTIVHLVKTFCPEKTVWIYTGYTLEELSRQIVCITLFPYIDVLVDGEFMEEKKNLMLEFRGSENQRIIDMKKTLDNHKVTLWENPQKGRM